jgi:hypothetical protein
MNTLQIVLTSVLPVLGVLLGAGLQYYFSRASDTRKQLETLRTTAYIDFIRSVSALATYQRLNNPAMAGEAELLMTDAKTRIAVYGSNAVVNAIAAFWRGGAVLDTPERMRAFTGILQKIRTECLPPAQAVLDREINQLLFSEDL